MDSFGEFKITQFQFCSSHDLTATATTAIQDQLLTLLRNPISKTSTVNKSFHVILELTNCKTVKKQGIAYG